MKTEFLTYDDFEIGNFKIKNYNSFMLSEIRNYLDSLDDNYYTYIKITDNVLIEKVIFDYYDTENYYDLILFINNREMLYDMPYSYDIILNNIDKDINAYEYKVFGTLKNELSEKSKSRLVEKLNSEYIENNKKLLYIKIIKKQYINEILRKITYLVETQKELYSLMENTDD